MEAVNVPAAGVGDQLDLAGLPGFEAHRGAGRDIETETPRLVPVNLNKVIEIER